MTKQLSIYNLLFIGNSSLDKSTIINAFANYLHFGEFYKAIASEKLIQIVPSVGTTTLIHPETFENFVIRDEDEQESEETDDGEIQNYLIKYQDNIIRIINTPDFDKDFDKIKQKFETIVDYLQRFDKLHAICCFVETDSTDEQIKLFEAIFSELICNFSKSVLSNLIFCVSYNQSPSNGFGGNGHQKLKQLFVEKLAEFEIELIIGENCFYLENDVYQFAKKRGFPCTKLGLDFYEENWNRSSELLKKLLDHIIFNVEPRNLNESFTLSKAQKWFPQMEKPLDKLDSIFEMIGPILNSIILLNEKIESCTKKISEINENNALKKKQFSGLNQFKVVLDFEEKTLDKPKMVCTSSSCRTFVKLNEKKRTVYKTVCHPECFPNFKITTFAIEELLKNCPSIDQLSMLCKICGCRWQSHKRILKEYVRVERTVLDENVEKQIFDGKTFIAENVKSIKIFESLMEKYNEELKIIFEVSAKFGYFLLVNSNLSFQHFHEATDLFKNVHIRRFLDEHYESVLELVEERAKIGEELIEDLCVKLNSLKHTESNFNQKLLK